VVRGTICALIYRKLVLRTPRVPHVV
jgi:hypothetical protein